MKIHTLLILPITLTALVSCTTIQVESNTSARIKHGIPGGEVVQTTRITATVTSIDAAKRKVTLVTPKDEKLVVKAGPEVANFAQIRIGDQLNVTLTEEIVIRMAKPGEKTDDGRAALIGIAPIGAKPGVLTAETHQTTATVTAIDLRKRKATLQFPDGTSKKIAVRPDVDLSKRKVGEKVVIRITETLAVLMEKP